VVRIPCIENAKHHARVDDYRAHSSRNLSSCVAVESPGTAPTNSSNGSLDRWRRMRPSPLAWTRSSSPWDTRAAF